MQRLYTPADAERVADAAMRHLILQRFAELAEIRDFSFDELAEFWLVEPSDTVESLEAATQLPITLDWFSDVRYPDPDFSPSLEVLEAHPTCFELVFVTNDSGYGIVLWIAKAAADPVLLAMCAEYTTPAPVDPRSAT